ncbi:MAG: hypothetical protein AAB693_02505 [Patescibacteria group bacterium]|mgnify:CR=1 FL=1
MLSLPLILFLISLIGIIGMVVAKSIIIEKDKLILQSIQQEHPLSEDFQKIKKFLRGKFKNYTYFLTFIILRFFINLINFLKEKIYINSKKISAKYNSMLGIDENKINGLQEEPSPFVKTMSEYKEKIRKIKFKIKKENKEK